MRNRRVGVRLRWIVGVLACACALVGFGEATASADAPTKRSAKQRNKRPSKAVGGVPGGVPGGMPTVGRSSRPNRSNLRRTFLPPRSTRVEFGMVDTALGSDAKGRRPFPWARGSAVAISDQGVLAVDPTAQVLVLTDETGRRIAQMNVGRGVEQLVYHPPTRRAYLADRLKDRILIVDVGQSLRLRATIKTPVEPYGIALTPSGKTVAVTAVADQLLVGYDTRTMRKRWSAHIGPEPRGIAFSPDGNEAIVTMLTTTAVAKIDFVAKKPPRVSYVSITPRDTTPAGGRSKAFVRNAFGVEYVANDLAVVPFQLSRPVAEGDFVDSGQYGGGGRGEPQIEHRLAFIRGGRGQTAVATAVANTHQPRSIAYDQAQDRLYVAGLGSDELLAIDDASARRVRGAWQRTLAFDNARCGPSGLAIDGKDVVVYCSFSHQVMRVPSKEVEDRQLAEWPGFQAGPRVADSRLSAEAERGRQIFHIGEEPTLSGNGVFACASCHPDGRADGLSWQIEGHTLQTPLLGGRIRATHPYKWDGQDPTISQSVRNTVRRLGGHGLTEAEAKDLRAFLDTLPRPRVPTVRDTSAVRRGRDLFVGTAECVQCHSGSRLTDRKSYPLAKDLAKVDTPSLIGLAASAPYYHDGSAQTLEAALKENGTVHDMGTTHHLTDAQVGDLVAYLRTL